MSKYIPPKNDREALERMVKSLEAINRRDRLRMIGSTIHGILSFIPLILFLASVIYLYRFGDELIERYAALMTQQFTGGQGAREFEQMIRQFMQR